MHNDELLNRKRYIIVKLLSLSSKLKVHSDRSIANDGVTIKQWVLITAIAQFESVNPSLTEVAELMNSSHQNIKQLALKLQHNGYIQMETDVNDHRAVRLRLKEKSYECWRRIEERLTRMLQELFQDFDRNEIILLHECLSHLSKSFESRFKNKNVRI